MRLAKAEWDALDVERIAAACDPGASADLAVVLIAEGLANVCLVGRNTTLVSGNGAAAPRCACVHSCLHAAVPSAPPRLARRLPTAAAKFNSLNSHRCRAPPLTLAPQVPAKVEVSLPRKRGAAAAGYDKAWAKFLDACFAAVVRHVDWAVVKCLVIAGPGQPGSHGAAAHSSAYRTHDNDRGIPGLACKPIGRVQTISRPSPRHCPPPLPLPSPLPDPPLTSANANAAAPTGAAASHPQASPRSSSRLT